jgi:uncharacterized membrane protein YedE/YeeE
MYTRGGLFAANALFGTVLGFSLSNIGFGDYAQLNKMFTFQDTRMFFTFVGGVVIAAIGTAVLIRRRPARTRIHAGIVPGALLFGTGWAISGGCPAIPIVQLATGYLPALITLGGLIAGMRAYRWVNGRYLHLDQGSCGL